MRLSTGRPVQRCNRVRTVREDGPGCRSVGEEARDRGICGPLCRAAQLRRYRLLPRRHCPNGYRRAASGQIPCGAPAGGARFRGDCSFGNIGDLDRAGWFGVSRQNFRRDSAGATGPGLHERLYRWRRALFEAPPGAGSQPDDCHRGACARADGAADAKADDDDRGAPTGLLLPPLARWQAYSVGGARQFSHR
ncbi:hypothetical protein D9M69_503640 [compost metagenome]